MYRNKRILNEARNWPCQFCGVRDGTVVAAHSNQQRHGKGMGIKAHDIFVAFLDGWCHHALDQGSGLSKEERDRMWATAHRRTVEILNRVGLVDDEARALLDAAGDP